MSGMEYEERLEVLGLTTLKRKREDMIQMYKKNERSGASGNQHGTG